MTDVEKMPDTRTVAPWDGTEGAGTVLSSWRRAGPRLGRRQTDRLRRILDGPVALHREGWRIPARVDPAEAVGVAIDLCEAAELRGPAVDVVMSTLLLHALDGNPAAALVLDHARRKAARTLGRDDAAPDRGRGGRRRSPTPDR